MGRESERETPPLSLDVARSTAKYLASWLAYRQRYLRVPGVQAAVLLGDEIVLSTAAGVADIASTVVLTPHHLFRVASHSKTFTATAVLQLFESGALRLDDRLRDWVPELRDADAGDRTLRELLSHSSGIVRDGEDADFWQLRRDFPDAAELRKLAAAPEAVVLPANERFKYSNISYGLLGVVIEAASGRTYDSYVREEVVGRLGLRDTGPEFESTREGDLATGYSALSYAEERVPIEHVDTHALAAATGFYSTAEDLCQYAAAHFWGDSRLLSDSSKRLMQHEAWAVEGMPDASYGLGFSIIKCGERRLVGHGGGYPGHSTRTVFDPDERLAVAVLTNSIDGPAEELATAVVKVLDLAARQELQLGDDAQRFCLRLANVWGVRDIVLLGGRLFVLDPSQPDFTESSSELTMVDDTTLRVVKGRGYGATGEQLRYEFTEDGTVRSVHGPGGMTWWPLDEFQLPGGGVKAHPV